MNHRHAGGLGRLLGMLLALATLATLFTATAAAQPGGQTLDMRVLVIAADGNETDYSALTGNLDRLGIPYDVLVSAQTPLTEQLLWDGDHGFYSSILLTSGHLWYFDPVTGTYPGGFDVPEWNILHAYQRTFKVRSASTYTWTGGWPNYGLTTVGYQDTTPSVGGTLGATLTPAGAQVFGHLNPTATIEVGYAWTYLGTVADPAVTTPLLVTDAGYPLAFTTTYADGREHLGLTMATNDWGIHSKLLMYGLIDWVTDGLYIGARRTNFSPQVDDLLIPSDIWDIAAQSDQTGREFRMGPADWRAARAWQASMRSRYSTTSALSLEWAFNGEGASGSGTDRLEAAIRANNAEFSFINHTYTHLNMDNVTTAAARIDISRNDTYGASASAGYANFARDSLVNPDISGLNNPNFHQAVVDSGIQYVISDVSQPGWGNPSPNTGIQSQFQPSLLIIPRRANNLFYNLRTPAQWVSEYNCYYGPNGTCAGGAFRFWSQNLTYDQILDVEANQILTYLLDWDLDPLMFHQANMGTYDGTHSLLTDLIDVVMAKYNSLVDLPVSSLDQTEIGKAMRERMRFDAANVTATTVPCVSLTLVAQVSARVPVTGVSFGSDVEVYGGDPTSYLNMVAGTPVVIPLTCS